MEAARGEVNRGWECIRHAMMEPTGGQAQSDRGSKSTSLGISRTAVVLAGQNRSAAVTIIFCGFDQSSR